LEMVDQTGARRNHMIVGLGALVVRRGRARALAEIRARWGEPVSRERKMEAIAESHRSRLSNMGSRALFRVSFWRCGWPRWADLRPSAATWPSDNAKRNRTSTVPRRPSGSESARIGVCRDDGCSAGNELQGDGIRSVKLFNALHRSGRWDSAPPVVRERGICRCLGTMVFNERVGSRAP